MKLKFLLFMFSFFIVLSLSSQNVKADCTYGGVPSGLQDQEVIFNCIKVSDSICDSSCGAWTEGCDGTKVKVKVITQCYSAGLLTSCRLLQGGDHIESGVRYTYKDCASETVNKLCYGGACVECLSDTDCPSTKPKCDTSTHTCKEATTPTCNYNSIQDNGETGVDCGGGGCPTCTAPVACSAASSYTTSSTCSGAVSGSGASCGYYWCASPNTPGNTCVQSAVNCAAPPPSTTCSGLSLTDCNGNSNCKWCGNFGANICVSYSASCPSASCSGKSQSACTGACSWCSNTISGASYSGGGVCYAASDLSTACGGCYTTGTWTISNNYAYCSGSCPANAASAGYYGGWCTIGTNCDSSYYGQVCYCTGNTFNTAKSTDGIVNCGECAINANGKDCGGTAVTGKETNCADGIDNDRDCLVDCADPDCAIQVPCTASSFTVTAETVFYGTY